MATLTVRNIPDRALERLREWAVADRRSLNNEIVVVLENAVEPPASPPGEGSLRVMSAAAQIQRWEDLCGRWRDDREWEEIVSDIAGHRTAGREVAL